MDAGTPGAEIPTAGAAAPNAQRGFVITIKCVTPFAGGVGLIDSAFIPNLMALKPGTLPPNKPYGVLKAVIARKMRVGDDATRTTKLTQDYTAKLQREAATKATANAAAAAAAAQQGTPGAYMPGNDTGEGFNPVAGVGMGGVNGNQFPPEAYQDPILKEDVRDDTECTMVFVVQLDPPPPAPAPAAAPGTPAAPGAPAAPAAPGAPAVPAAPAAAVTPAKPVASVAP
jgi:hypothetical protein